MTSNLAVTKIWNHIFQKLDPDDFRAIYNLYYFFTSAQLSYKKYLYENAVETFTTDLFFGRMILYEQGKRFPFTK